MNPKEELGQYKFKIKKVSEALDEYERFKERAEKVTAIISDNPAHSNKISDKVGDNASKMADLNKEYQDRWLEAERERLNLVDKINRIDEPYRTILVERYIHEKSFEQIAVEMAYSYDWTAHLHRRCFKRIFKTRQLTTRQNIY